MSHIPRRIDTSAASDEPSPPVGVDSGEAAMRGLSEVLASNEILHVAEDYVVVTPKESRDAAISMADPTVQDMTQMGVSGATMYHAYLKQDYNPELRGLSAIMTYEKMRKTDAEVRKALRLMKTPVLAARWYMQPHLGGTNEEGQAEARNIDRLVSEYVWKNLTEWMSISWWQVLNDILLMLDYGFYIMEKVYEFGPDGRVRLKKLAPIHPIDVLEWEYDPEGGPRRVKVATGNPDAGIGSPGWVWIPIEKLAVFTYDREANNMSGNSVLRTAYLHWYFRQQLFKIDAIQKERHGIGIPIIKLPPGFTKKDRQLANEMGSNLRTNERAHVVLPPNWEIEFVKIEGQSVDALESAKYHGSMIIANILGEFVDTGSTRSSAVEAQWNIFQKAAVYIADIIKDTFNKWVIPDLVDMNWRVSGYPELRARRIGDTTDWRTISFAMRNFIGAGALEVDDPLEDWIRDEMDLPAKDPETTREVETPQGGPRVGPPRQTPPSPNGAGRGNSGDDRSGG